MNKSNKTQTPLSVIHKQESEGFVTETISTGFWWKCFVFLRFCFLVLAGVFGALTTHIQNSGFPVPSPLSNQVAADFSIYYDVFELMETGKIVRREVTTGGDSWLPSNQVLMPNTNVCTNKLFCNYQYNL